MESSLFEKGQDTRKSKPSKLRQYYEEYEMPRKILLPLVILVIGYFIQCTLMNWYSGPIIKISQGKLQGRWATSREGKKYAEFYNIPYASAQKRFQTPQKAKGWDGIRNAQKPGPECSQIQFITTGRIQGEEDCLNLNVYVSSVNKNNTHHRMLPTFVYFHGGAFVMGSHEILGAKYFGDFLDEVILVTVQYRLGAFGFLNTGDDLVKGNMALKDMQMSLKWIRDNIEYFPGGDKNNIVIAGESAGGIAVNLLMMSHSSKGLFHKAVSMSGVAVNFDFGWKKNHTEAFISLARRVNCNQSIRDEILECLENVDSYKISQVQKDDMYDLLPPLNNFFLPAVESTESSNAFICQSPDEILKTGQYSTVPYMVGVNEMDGLVYVLRLIQGGMNIMPLQQRSVWNKYMPHLLFLQQSNNPQQISNQLYDHYFGKHKGQLQSEDNVIRILSNAFSDRFFFQGSYNAAVAHSKFAKTYLYYYTHQSPKNVFNLLRSVKPSSFIPFELEVGYGIAKRFVLEALGYEVINYGAGHGDDVSLLFASHPAMEITQNSEDYAMSRSLIRLMVDFAKTSTPLQYENIEWSPVNASKKVSCMNLNEASPHQFPECPIVHRAKFWNSLDL